jgi:hypothetical protein
MKAFTDFNVDNEQGIYLEKLNKTQYFIHIPFGNSK